MRSIRTFVLHVVVDPTAPTRLCGDLRALDGTLSLAFRDSSELIEQLRQLIHASPEVEPPAADGDSES